MNIIRKPIDKDKYNKSEEEYLLKKFMEYEVKKSAKFILNKLGIK